METTLFKRRANGTIQVTRRETANNMSQVSTGVSEGQMNTFDTVYHDGKNIGRSNETTPEEQALLEHDSWVTKKLRTGYVRDEREVDNHSFIKPMLAKAYDPKKVVFPPVRGNNIATPNGDKQDLVFVQPKLDGIRCVATAEGLFTRTNKPILSCPHIEEALKPFFVNHPDMVVDGEIYNHDMNEDFNGIISLVRKTKGVDFEKTKVLQYHIYDVMDEDRPYIYRMEKFSRLAYQQILDNDCLQQVDTETVTTVAEIEDFNSDMLAQGYEGIMVRLNDPYKAGRQWRLMKYKQWHDAEFTIKGFEEGKGEHEGLASVVIVDVDGVECRPTMTGTKQYRQDVLDDALQYIGGKATIKYFEKTPDGSLRFPTVKAVYKKERDM